MNLPMEEQETIFSINIHVHLLLKRGHPYTE